MSRPKGLPKTGGRRKGTRNKLTRDLRSMILGALEAAGGQEYLQRQADGNPGAFLSLLGKAVPKEVSVDAKGTLIVKVVTGVPDA